MNKRPTPMLSGTRVRHAGEQYPEALREGTADIVGHFWIGDHLEYRVVRDGVRRDRAPEEREWAFYHTRKAEDQP